MLPNNNKKSHYASKISCEGGLIYIKVHSLLYIIANKLQQGGLCNL